MASGIGTLSLMESHRYMNNSKNSQNNLLGGSKSNDDDEHYLQSGVISVI